MNTIRKKRKKNRKNGLKIFVILCTIAFLGLFFFLIRVTLLSNNFGIVFVDKVLLQLNNDHYVTTDGNEIHLMVSKSKNIKDVFIELEDAINRENGTILDYSIRKNNRELVLTLFVNLNNDENRDFKFIVRKQFSKQDKIQYEIPFQKPDQEAKNKICIIIDDAGYNSELIYSYVELPIKMGIAVLPCLRNSRKIASLIHENNKEVLMHMPMEPEDYETREIKLMPKEILTSMSRIDIFRTMKEMLNTVPYASGINNHQGSRATSDRKLMHAVLSKVESRNMYFIDSLTGKKSVTRKMAKKLQINYGIRDVFLDNIDEYDYIKTQMEELIRISLKRGKAIGIGHIGKINTYQVIKDYIPCIKAKGIKLVYPSEIIDKFYNKEVSNNVTENINYFN